MTWGLVGVLVFVLLLGAFVFLAVPHGRWRIAVVSIFVCLVAVLFAGAFKILGKPKPIELEWRQLSGDAVRGVLFKENVAIYLWLEVDGEPITLVLPWNIKDAQSLQDGIKSAREGGGTVKLTRRIDRLPDAPTNGEISEVVPPEALPEKEPE